uniref:Fasciculation and elongation protein zeta 1 n=1 Tax=Meleagris gallopavo TaxID=9103 RepID=G1MPV8_MELGA
MEAPLVSLEEEFEEGPGDNGGAPQRTMDPALAELESFSTEMMSFKSMEDLVQEFDEKLTVCFRNYDATTEGLAPVRGRLQAQEEEEHLQDEEVWDALTDGFVPRGSPQPWMHPEAEAPDGTDPQLCEKEDEELAERSEHDSGINEEPLLTAEQVIEELEELMQSSPDPEADPEGDEDEEEEEDEEEDAEVNAEGDGGGRGMEPIVLRELHTFSPTFNNNCSHEGLEQLTAGELAAAAGRAEAASRALSAELVAQLARRDELAFEKEVKTAFIGALLAVQGEQREQREAARRRRRDRGLSLQGGRPERGDTCPESGSAWRASPASCNPACVRPLAPLRTRSRCLFPPTYPNLSPSTPCSAHPSVCHFCPFSSLQSSLARGACAFEHNFCSIHLTQ